MVSIVKLFIASACFAFVSAHMGLSPSTAIGGSRQELEFRISHDCGDDTVGTTNFTVQFPMHPPMFSLKVEQTDLWRTFIKMKKLDTPIKMGKYTFDEVVSEVTWLGFLPDGIYRTFRVRGIVPQVMKETTVWFKGYQDCHNQGTSLSWATIPTADDPSPRYPARSLTISPAEM